jgi:hypothetical protein
MTSQAKIAANRRNARGSTGPRTAAGKMRVRRNALRHGLAALVANDPAVVAEVDRVAAAICDEHADPLEQEQALIVAEVEVTLKRVRKARVQIMEQLQLAPGTKELDGQKARSMQEADRSAPRLDQLLRLERYERRALSRRKRAVRSAALSGSEKIAQKM